MGVEIWCDCTSYASWLCEEKERLKKWLCEMEMRMKDPGEGENEKKRKEKEMKWHQRGRIKKGVRSLGRKTQKFTSERLQMRSVFGYGRVSFGKSPRMTMHCMIECKH